MLFETDENERCRILHKETLEIFESLERLGDRFGDRDQQLTDAEAEQSIECLRADLERLSRDIERATNKDPLARDEDASPGSDILLPAVIGGLALGAVIEKSRGGDFSSKPSISPP